MRDTLFVLGASDPEMEAIEKLVAACGMPSVYALGEDGQRVHPGNAYRAAKVSAPVHGATRVALVECDFPDRTVLNRAPGEVAERGEEVNSLSATAPPVVVVDHHRPGDPGYGRPPKEAVEASSLGQVISLLAETCALRQAGWRETTHAEVGLRAYQVSADDTANTGQYVYKVRGPNLPAPVGEVLLSGFEIPHQLALVAAADHCLAAAYRGECLGIDPDRLMQWRAESRAAYQGRSVEEVLDDIDRASQALRDGIAAPYCNFCSSFLEDEECQQCPHCHGTGRKPGVWGLEVLSDLRGQPHIPELPEAAAREGIPFLATVRDRDGREKVVLQAATPSLVKEFLEGKIVRGLVDYYGDPARGFAGGYLPVSSSV